MKRYFVVVGGMAKADPGFSLLDLPGTSGRLDILLRCLRAAMLVSHGLRRHVVTYLVLHGGEHAPRVLRFDSALVRFLRPDERSLALRVQKALATVPSDLPPNTFVEVRRGIAVARGSVEAVLADIGEAATWVLEEGACDVREATFEGPAHVFFVGDHYGWDDATRSAIEAAAAKPIGIGPISVHADDAIAVLSNELDRRSALSP